MHFNKNGKLTQHSISQDKQTCHATMVMGATLNAGSWLILFCDWLMLQSCAASLLH